MRINTNILSLSAQRNLATTTRALARAMEKLASGSRINSARDDAAGLAISSGLEAQRRGMLQAIRNMNDARGFLDTAEGAIAEQTNIIQRMRELALQSANGTLSSTDRAYLENEFQQLNQEFERISEETEFNGVHLLDGSFTSRSLQVGTRKGETLNFTISRTTIESSETILGGGGTFTSGTAGPTINFKNTLISGDFNNDSVVDIVSSDNTNGLKVYLGQGDSSFVQSASISGANNPFVEEGDVNGDGQIDIVASPNAGGLYLTLGNGNGTFQALQTVYTGTIAIVAPALADLDGDGDKDLAFTSTAGILHTFFNNGSGVFSGPTTTSVGTGTINTNDFNGDGKDDLLIGSSNLFSARLYLSNGNGTFQSSLIGSITEGGYDLDIEDLNDDGYLDIVSGGPVNQSGTQDWIHVYLGNGNGTFRTPLTYTAPDLPNFNGGYVDTGDLNDDGILDIVRSDGANNSISIFFGNGDGTFQSRSAITTSATANNVIIADITGDSYNDLIVKAGSTILTYVQDEVTISEAAEISIATQSSAEDILEILDTALQDLLESRSSIGAIQSRLGYAQSNALNQVENISAAKSQITDTDYASETAEFTRLQVLQQAGLAVLSQANMNHKLTLQLLQNLNSTGVRR